MMRGYRGGKKNKKLPKRARADDEESEVGSVLSSEQTWKLCTDNIRGRSTEAGADASRGTEEESMGVGAGRDSRTYQGITSAPRHKGENEPSSSSGSKARPFGKKGYRYGFE